MLVGVLYAASDEFHQSFVPGRGPSIVDVGIDSLGVLTGILAVLIIISIYRALKSDKKLKRNVKAFLFYFCKIMSNDFS